MTRTHALGALLLCAFVGGTGWWPFRALQERGLHPLWTLGLVYAVAVLALGPSALRPGPLGGRSPLQQVLSSPPLWALGAAFGTMNAAFFWSVSIGDVIRAVLLFNLMPLWAALLAWWLLGERPTRRSGLGVALALAGAAWVLWPSDRAWEGWRSLPWPREPADGLALLGGAAFALNNVLLRRHAEQPQPAQVLAMFLGGMGVAGTVALALHAAGQLPGMPPVAPGWLGITALLSLWFLLGNCALQYGATRLPANTTSVTMLSEIVFAAASAVVLGGSQPTLAMLGGGALIFAAAWLSARTPAST
ncbi:MAG: DMT family transporter [Inhella sp.]|uniref:DMT family transporter n=1 Tax=Inhella sp. TaxID=1921806 RepID=UPI0022BB8FF1|nr:DMT family transporter [Inhella sp.]MCZ8235362.1 DMT family transporter [Inhella sp.]